MQVVFCICGQRLSAVSPEEAVEALRAHVHEAHGHWGIPDQYLRDLRTTAAKMAVWDGRAAALEEAPAIHPLTPARLMDFLRFFDRYAFMDNPLWAGCYCMHPHFAGTDAEWLRRSPAQNRDEKRELIRGGRARGYMAYVGATPVAWCHAAPRAELPGLARLEDYQPEDSTRVGAIACFVVSAPYRRQGLARRLLDAACESFRAEGLTVAEGYPPKEPRSDAGAHRGPLDMYLSAGFKVHFEGRRLVVVRRPLT